ncbi:MAG TPA: efflux RND transporter periplasmic adaptor subunit [Candidatus Sulfotelmatobacter sp.]|nr:efflux RND transporter periplasmic adaptor subunit [Candidatus Sulfotelmatobacter sp.]
MRATVIAATLAIALAGCGAAPQQSETARPTPVAVADVQEYSGGEGVNYSASIVPYTQLPLAFKSSGYLTNILQRPGANGKPRNLQQGDYVKKDTVVATVRQADYQRSVDQYKGQLEQAQAGRLKSEQDFARADALYKANALTQSDYDAAKAQFDSTQGAVATAQAAVAQAQQALADCELRAPMDGQILARNVELGMLVGSGTQAFTMGDMELVKAIFGIPDTLLSRVGLKQRQGIRTETYAQEFFGQISAVSPQADQKSRTFQVEVTIPNPKGLLKSGMVATLDIGGAKLRSPALVVPIEAIVSPADGSRTFSVFVVTHQGDRDTVHRRTVQPGAAFGNMVSIVEGVSRGEKIVTNGATLVNDGQIVHVIP